MSKPEAGQWWVANEAKTGDTAVSVAVRIEHILPNENIVVEKYPNEFWVWTHANAWHHEPRCTGWDWVVPEDQPQPAEDPDEWVELTNPKHVLRRDIDFTNTAMLDIWEPIFAWHGDTIERVHCWGYKNSRFRCRRRDLPKVEQARTTEELKEEFEAREAALAAIDARLNEQPEQWPKYYAPHHGTMNDNVAFIKRVSQRSAYFVYLDGCEGDSWTWAEADDLRKQLTEAEAMALLKKPEPIPDCVHCNGTGQESDPDFCGGVGSSVPKCKWCNGSGKRKRMFNKPDPQPAKTLVDNEALELIAHLRDQMDVLSKRVAACEKQLTFGSGVWGLK